MRFGTSTTLFALASTTTAASLGVQQACSAIACTYSGTWTHNDGSRDIVNANDGCRSTDIDGMESVCFDWGRSPARLHFNYEGEARRCMEETSSEADDSCEGMVSCNQIFFSEVTCSW